MATDPADEGTGEESATADATEDEPADEETVEAESTERESTEVGDDIAEEGAIPEADPEQEITDEEQTWAVLTHASGLLGLLVPFGNLLGPLLIWLIKREESAFVDESGKAALNFQLSWTLLLLLALVSLLLGVGIVLVPTVALAWLVLVVIATARASDREVYDYPLTFEFIE